jgi:hypothetical protein
MSIRTVNKQIRKALRDNVLTQNEAETIVKTAEKGPLTTGEARRISDLYERGEWFMPDTFPLGAFPQPRPPEYEMTPGARSTLMQFFEAHEVPQGTAYGDVKKAILASFDESTMVDHPATRPSNQHNLHRVTLRDRRAIGGSRLDAYLDTRKDVFFVKQSTSGFGALGGPQWFGPFKVEDPAERTPTEAVDAANKALAQIHNRLTEEIRTEDGISNLSLRDDGTVAVVVRPHTMFTDAQLTHAAKALLADAGLPDAEIALVKAAIQPVPPFVMVADANAALREIQSRLTADIRAEDDISNFSLRDDGTVAIVVRPHAYYDDGEIQSAADALLKEAGLAGYPTELVRPAVDPFFPFGAH